MGSLSASLEPLQYPPARRDESVVDDYHGVKVADPYRWLEDPDAEEVKDFVEKQANLTESLLRTCAERERLRGRSCLDGRAEVLLDPNLLSEDGTTALSTYSVSLDAKYLAYGLSASGSDWVTINVMRVDDKKPEPDSLSWVKFSSISWTHDGRGFFYSRYPAPKKGDELDAGTETNINLYHELYYHFLGTDQSEDILCWKDPESPKHMFAGQVTEDGKYVLLYITEGCDPVNKLYYCDLSSLHNGLQGVKEDGGMLPFIKLVDNFEASYESVANDNTEFTFLTNKQAPKYKLVRVDLRCPGEWSDVVKEDHKDVLESARAVNGNQILVSYLSDVKYLLQIRDLKTGLLLHNLPIDIGSVFIGFTSFLTSGIIYKCNLASETPELEIFREIVVPGFDRTCFEVKQVFISSRDDTKIPMFVVSKKDIALDGSHPCLLYGYGGFNISLTPSFSVSRIVLTRHLGVVFCIANIRGGGEYGEEWHKAGSLSNKQNCFDDFISAAEFLISAGYTNPRKLCIEGGSNGGLLVAACINQRPDLCGCALAHVGVMDMLDYGCSDKEEEFGWLFKYSPLHNVRRPWEKNDPTCQYPATMLLTADHDDRVVPLHSLKLLATMQYVLCASVENSPQTNPIVGRIDRKSGHGSGRPTQKMIDEAADRYSFMAKMLGASWID
ncbi:unnamed protein product [Spirodela intermedia]|uniref:Prolyl endopeptidase n=1 Tax=Spirodela intermedia TaxID=51605 RepID=A0A7I8J0A0_SPIIN|nr:unnamed protein product [Spirodela intermedia]CAA6663253.1 unnamed protein product [Spirodela intermedia]